MPGADQMPCGIVALRESGEILLVNDAFARMLGRPSATFAGQPIELVFTKAARVLYHTWVFPLLRMHERVEEVELSLLRGDGEEIDVILGASFEPGASAGDGLLRLAVMQVRARRWLEEQLLNARRATDQVPGVVFQFHLEVTGEFKFSYVSEGAWQVLGCSPAAMMSGPEEFAARISPEGTERLCAAVLRSASEFTGFCVEFQVTVSEELRWLRASGLPRKRADGSILWSGYIEDITIQRSIQTVEQERATAERASLAKSQFLARLSHELRNPLHTVINLARLLTIQAEARSAEDQTKLKHIHFAGQTMLRMINEVLDISQIEAGGTTIELEPIPIVRIVDAAIVLIAPVAEDRGVTLELSTSAWVWVRTDEQRAVQALTNLLSNAVKYNRPGGKATISVRADESTVRIEVRDEGPGLTEAQLEAIFRPYARLERHAQTEGTGLGLAITRALVERMSGQVTVRSEPGRGSSFCIILPRTPAPEGGTIPAAAAAAPVAMPASAAATRTVVYIEDEPVNLLVMRCLFELRPRWRFLTATTLSEGVALVTATAPDLVLVDMHLPDGNGIEAISRISPHSLPAHCRFVAVSAAAMPEEVARARGAGFHDYWTKPVDIEATLLTLDSLYPDDTDDQAQPSEKSG